MKSDLVTKNDLSLSINSLKDELIQRMTEMSEAILKGMDLMFKEERKFNEKTFATKEDLKRETSWIRNDIRDIEVMMSDKPSIKTI